MRAGERNYRCDTHGDFAVFVTREECEAGDVFERRCPQCGRMCELHQPRTRGLEVGCAPAVHGDVPRPYYSPFVNRVIASKADLRRAHAELGVVPMSDADLKASAEASESVMAEKRSTDRWIRSSGEATPVAFDNAEPVPAGAVVAE